MILGLILWAISATQAAPLPADASVETHAHLFMNEGMTWFFRGDFFGELKTTSWTDRFSQMTNPETVDRSGIHVLVATLYAHPLFSFDLRESVRRQISQAEQFVASRGDTWVIARDATQARRALESGRRVMILALEGAAGILETDADISEFVDQRGIRIVNPVHFTDDRFGASAFMGRILNFANPFSYLSQLFSAKTDAEGARLNERGLKPEGRELVQKLIDRGVWIDFAHASDQTQTDLKPLLARAGQPLFYSHTVLRKYFQTERAISSAQLADVARTHGVIGIMPSATMLRDTPVLDKCGREGVEALVVQYREMASVVGADSLMLGTDWNGGVEHLSPGCGGTGTSIDRTGYMNIGQVPELWTALRSKGAPLPAKVSDTVTRFLDAWSKVQKR